MDLSETTPEFFQICVNILEAKHLAWSTMDPIVCVQVDNKKKYTTVRHNTDCPHYNEYFVFDFHLPLSVLLEKTIILSVMHARSYVRRKKVLGRVSFDVATVWQQPDHQFYHKWAVLLEKNDANGSVKGYLKCDVSVIGKGDTVKVQRLGVEDDDDIEGNLLVPEGVTMERQKARYMIRVYRGEYFPSAGSKGAIDPCVQISLAGLTGLTSVKNNTNTPVWNEALVFNDAFPPLWQRIKVQLRDSDITSSNVIASHVLDLLSISNDQETNGFMPTLGPTFIHLYGGGKIYAKYSPHISRSDAGVPTLGNGAVYSGYLLLAIEMEAFESGVVSSLKESTAYGVSLRPIEALVEKNYWEIEEFLLVGVLWDISMLDRKWKGKSIQVEISIGNAGNVTQLTGVQLNTAGTSEYSKNEKKPEIHSTTSPQPVVQEGAYCAVKLYDDKPCVFVHSQWPDTTHRLHHSNLLILLSQQLRTGLSRVIMGEDEDEMKRVLSDVLSVLRTRCAQYLNITSTQKTCTTKLDIMRTRLCRIEVENMMNMSVRLSEQLTKDKVNVILHLLEEFLKRLKFYIDDPQHSLPDVFVWFVAGDKRIAFHRLSARDVFFSTIAEECGLECGRLQTLLMKGPAKKGDNTAAKLDIALWLGHFKHMHNCFTLLPDGYEPLKGFGHHYTPSEQLILPNLINYVEKHMFEFRAYVYQGRLKPGSDKTALCDSFVRIILGSQNKETQVQSATLKPTWDETLVLEEVTLYGSVESMKVNPPVVIIEVLDVDSFFVKELVGRTTARTHVKLADQPYYKSRLVWYNLSKGDEMTGEILASFELIEISENVKGLELQRKGKEKKRLFSVPSDIKPHMVNHRMEVLYWGLRDMKPVNMFSIKKPYVVLECRDVQIRSIASSNTKDNHNFTNPLQFVDLELPEQKLYSPPVTLNVYDSRSFGRSTYVGTHIQPSVGRFFVKLEMRDEYIGRLQPVVFSKLCENNNIPQDVTQFYAPDDLEASLDEAISSLHEGEDLPLLPRRSEPRFTFRKFTRQKEKKINKTSTMVKTEDGDIDDDETLDWWTKYFASEKQSEECADEKQTFLSTEEADVKKEKDKCKILFNREIKNERATFKIYPNELEAQPEFNNFNDFLQTFDIFRGKKTEDHDVSRENIVGKFKGTLKVYKWPPAEGTELVTNTGRNVAEGGVLQDQPSNAPQRLTVRVYVVRGSGFHSKDFSGRSDPYLMVSLGHRTISDKENYIPRQLNPIFGRCFELDAMLPVDYMLTVRVMDYDIAGSDDLIGETKIDIENRFYSQHRASCGLAQSYSTSGYNKWRDFLKPSQILAEFCRKTNMGQPLYLGDRVILGVYENVSSVKGYSETKIPFKENPRENEKQEELALYALRRWHEVPIVGCHLVPEHVETRSLYNPNFPGIEQGKLLMWVDMFPKIERPPPPPVDISPRKPQEYELRVIVWNTEDVVLQEDSFVSGQKMSDIYVKGWMLGKEDTQYTDVHYRSLSGEGNFNWRFVYRFKYLAAEDKLVIEKKESLFSSEITEYKLPCRLYLQIWDNDTFSKDDFLGSMTLELSHMPRGARSAKKCVLQSSAKDAPTLNLFKIRRARGWWPFQPGSVTEKLTGKLEAEFHLLPVDEAIKNPVGLGREGPHPIDEPKRPETSFLWFKSPLRTLKYIIWAQNKWLICRIVTVLLIIIFILIAIYSTPGYTIKRIIGA